ncbi:hypothetical protein Q1695_012029 [Nippostrongylus brasiliensis]|nr:hypothetical protein Q1695_012029 [Nippostrongylus brasiliensis]
MPLSYTFKVTRRTLSGWDGFGTPVTEREEEEKRVFDRICADLRAEISRFEEGIAAVARSRSGALLIQEEHLLQAEAMLEEVMKLVFEANADKRWMEKRAQKIRQRNASLQK